MPVDLDDMVLGADGKMGNGICQSAVLMEEERISGRGLCFTNVGGKRVLVLVKTLA